MYPVPFAPVPLRDTTWGPADALCAIVIVAVRVPMRSGSKLTYAVHDAPGLSVAPVQPSAQMGKSSGFVPPTDSDETTSGAVPVLVTLTTRPDVALPTTTEPKPTTAGVILIQGVSVPLRGITCGLLGALVWIVSDPLCAPAPVTGADA